MKQMIRHIRQLAFHDEKAQTSTEYAIALGVITTGIVVVLGELSGATQAAIERAVALIP
jgi:Flp pilus assembly pilin Flp